MIKENSFSKIMTNKTDSELLEYTNDRTQFQDDAVLAAIWELEKREKTDDNLNELKNEIEHKKIEEQEKNEEIKKQSNITDDPQAPLLYNPKFILGFGALFSVLAGGILMAMNFSRLNKKKTAWLVVLVSFIYMILQIVVLEALGTSSSALTLPVSLLGVYLLETLFWKKQVANNLKYRKRRIWGALIIALILWTPMIYSIILSGGM